MKAVVLSINFEEEGIMSTWFSGDDAEQKANGFLSEIGDDFPGWKHKVLLDAEAHNARFLKQATAFLMFEDDEEGS